MTEYLQKIGFSKLESEIYIELLKGNGLTGYQIAKNLNLSRSSVYPVLESMYKKGYALLVEGDAQSYVAEDPNVLLRRLKEEFVANTNLLDRELKSITSGKIEERFINISGFDQMLIKVKELLRTAKKEVIMNINGGITYLREEIVNLRKRGVRVIIFSFMKLDVGDLDVEFYSHGFLSSHDLSRIMLVVDFEQTLVADISENRPIWLGLLTNNTLMTSIISEHIHHDIYLLLFQRDGKETFDNKKINTILEDKRFIEK